MSARPLLDKIYEQAVRAYREIGSQRKAAEALGISRDLLRYRLEIAAGPFGRSMLVPGGVISHF
jgi:hypothetical protein